MRAGSGPGAQRAVALVSFAESALLPLPVDAVTLPVMLADRAALWRTVVTASVFSVLGGFAGYLLGLLLYETVVAWLIALYDWQEAFAGLKADFHERGVLIVLIGALSPIPFKLIAIASGVERLDLGLFLLTAAAGRGLRFAAFGLLVWRFGPAVRRLLDRHAGRIGWLVLALLVGGFLAVEWLL